MYLQPCQASRLRKAIETWYIRQQQRATLTASHLPSEKKKQMYLLTFLINVDINTRGWKVTWDSIKKNAQTFRGRPGLAYNKCTRTGCSMEHPAPKKTVEANLRVQEPYSVTTMLEIVFDETSHTAYVIHRVDDPEFAERIRRGEIKYLSPGVFRTNMSMSEVRSGLTPQGDMGIWVETEDWEGLHAAFVTKPAYGEQASIIDTCEGAGEYCMRRLRNIFSNKYALPRAA